MANFDSEVSTFEIDDTGAVQRDISAFIREIGGLPGARALNDISALGDSGVSRLPSLEDVSISLSGSWDNTPTTGIDAIMGPLRTHTAAVDFEYGPEGNSAGDFMYTGTCWIENYEVRSRVGSPVEWSATLQVEGGVSRGAHA